MTKDSEIHYKSGWRDARGRIVSRTRVKQMYGRRAAKARKTREEKKKVEYTTYKGAARVTAPESRYDPASRSWVYTGRKTYIEIVASVTYEGRPSKRLEEKAANALKGKLDAEITKFKTGKMKHRMREVIGVERPTTRRLKHRPRDRVTVDVRKKPKRRREYSEWDEHPDDRAARQQWQQQKRKRGR